MDITIHARYLPQDDPEEVVAIYRDVLGFVLHPPGADPGTTDDERRTIAEMMAEGTYAAIDLATKDLDGTFEQVQASGAEVVQEPIEQPYGVHDCAFRDPAGNMVRIAQA